MEEKLTIQKVGVRYAIYLTLVSIIYSVLLQILGLAANQKLGYIGIIFLIIAFVLAHNEYKKSNEYMSYGEGFKIALIMVLINSVVSALFTYVYVKFIDGSMMTTIRQQQEMAMEKRGMSEDQIQQAMSVAEKFSTPEMILIFGIFFGILFGIIVALLVTIFTRKSAPESTM
jgi:hypothetical protein